MSLTGNPEITTAQPISNDGFWPDASMGDLMGKYRIPAETPDDVIQWGLMLAMVRVNSQLDVVKTEIISLSFATFNAYITANTLPFGDTELLHVHYEHAIYARAKAMLLQQFKTMNRRKIAENEAKESDETEQYWLDESAQSIAAIKKLLFPNDAVIGKANTHVALI